MTLDFVRITFILSALLAAMCACSTEAVPLLTESPSTTPSPPLEGVVSPISPVDLTPTPQPPSPVQTEAISSTVPDPATNETAPIPSSTPDPLSNLLSGVHISRTYFDNGLRFVAESGSNWVAGNSLIWSVVELVEGDYNWGAMKGLEKEMEDTSELDLELILGVREAPFWAQSIPGYPCGPIRPEKFSAFGDFLYEAVLRYSYPPYNIKYWEIWNEPDASWTQVNSNSPFGCWGDESDPYFGGRLYGEMLKSIYPLMKAANPDVQVLVGGLLLDCDPRTPIEISSGSENYKNCSSARFLEGILKSGAGDFFDGIGFHAYDYYYGALGDYRNPNWNSAWNTTGPSLIAKRRFLQEVLDSYGYSDKYLMNTETALLCGQTGNEPICQKQDFQDTKAAYLAENHAAARAEGLRANIWFSLLGWRSSGLVSNGGLVPYQAYQSLVASNSILSAATYQGVVDGYPGVWGYRFQRDAKEVWIVWSIDGPPHPLELPQTPDAIYDVAGAPLPAAREVEVGLSPLWVVFPASPA